MVHIFTIKPQENRNSHFRDVSPSAKANIAYASLHDPWNKDKDKIIAEIYYQKDLEMNRVMEEATIVTKPFFDPERRRTTPAEHIGGYAAPPRSTVKPRKHCRCW